MRAVCQAYSLLMMEGAADFRKASETDRDNRFKLLLDSATRQFGNSHRKALKEEDSNVGKDTIVIIALPITVISIISFCPKGK